MKPLLVRFDNNFTSVIQNVPSINGFMNFITLLGDPILITATGLSGMAYGWINNSPRLTGAYGSAIAVYAVGGLLKVFLHRTRPDTVYVTAMRFKSYSFPSAHALGSLIIFGILAYLVYQHFSSLWNVAISVLLLTLVFLIGISRIYLGAHYPSDVVGGWIIGGVALYLIIKYRLV